MSERKLCPGGCGRLIDVTEKMCGECTRKSKHVVNKKGNQHEKNRERKKDRDYED